MSDPPRLSRHLKGGLAAKLIDSARDDDPPRAARQRALLAVGTSGGAFLAASAAKGAAISAGAAAGGSTAPAGTTTGAVVAWGALAKWVGGGAMAAVVTAGAVAKLEVPTSLLHRPSAAVLSHHNPSPSTLPIPPRVESRPEAIIVVAPTVDPPTLTVPPAELERPHIVTTRPAAREPAGDATSEAARRAAATANLVGEVAALDRAREAVSAGSGEHALAALDEYDRRFPGGTLAIESQVLRIESLAQKGDREKAARLAEAFLAQHPSSAHGARVRSVLVSIRKERAP